MAIREGRWKCDNCNSENFGSLMSCKNCGNHRGKNVKFYLPDNEPIVKDLNKLAEAKSGPDWTCLYCSTNNRAFNKKCNQCGQSKSLAIDNSPKIKISPPTSSFKAKNKSNTIGLFICLSIFACVSFLIYFYCFSYKTVLTKIENKNWLRTIYIEEYKTVLESGWNLPQSAKLISSSSKIHHYDRNIDHYDTRTRQVSKRVQVGTEKVVVGHRDLGNGYFEDIISTKPIYKTEYETEYYQEPIYRNDPVYKTYYVYNIDKWVKVNSVTKNGTNSIPTWPLIELHNKLRENGRVEQYTLNLKDVKNNNSFTYTLSSEKEWNMYTVNQLVSIKISRTGHIKEILLPEQNNN